MALPLNTKSLILTPTKGVHMKSLLFLLTTLTATTSFAANTALICGAPKERFIHLTINHNNDHIERVQLIHGYMNARLICQNDYLSTLETGTLNCIGYWSFTHDNENKIVKVKLQKVNGKIKASFLDKTGTYPQDQDVVVEMNCQNVHISY